MKILVIQMKMMGDVLAGTVVCETIKQQQPTAEIHYLVNRNMQAILDNHPAIDKLLLFDANNKHRSRTWWQLLQTVRSQQYEVIYDLYCKTQSQLISLFSGVPRRISYDKWYSRWCYSDTVYRQNRRTTTAGPAIENRLRLVYQNQPLPQVMPLPKIYLSSREQAAADQQLHLAKLNHQSLVMVSALGSGDKKTWPLSHTAAMLDVLVANYQVALLLNYVPNQRQQAEQLYHACQPETRSAIHMEVYGENLRAFLALLNRCRAIVGNEGGAINMGKALNRPSFSIYAPWVNPDTWGMAEDGMKHSAVHLRDFEPKLFQVKRYKTLKPQAAELYQQLTPKRVLPKFADFCQHNLGDLRRS